MPNWNTRLEVQVAGQLISPIDSFVPTFNIPHTVLHSLEQENVGFVRNPSTFTFIMTIRAIGSNAADLTEMALDGTTFDVVITESTGSDWSFKKLMFNDCIITSANPSNIQLDGVPAVTFNCAALHVKPEKK